MFESSSVLLDGTTSSAAPKSLAFAETSPKSHPKEFSVIMIKGVFVGVDVIVSQPSADSADSPSITGAS